MTPGSPLVRRSAVAAQSDGLITHYHDAICTDRVAIVTGGSRSVGREVVRKLANRGHAVVVGYIRDQGAADRLAGEARPGGGTTRTIPGRRPRGAERRRNVGGAARGRGGHQHLGPRA